VDPIGYGRAEACRASNAPAAFILPEKTRDGKLVLDGQGW
jgi:hypothetical protein